MASSLSRETQAVLRSILLDSPPGQIKDVLADLVALLPGHEDALEAFLTPVVAEVVARDFTPVVIPGTGRKCLLTPDGLLEGPSPSFIDPSSRQVIHVDFSKASAGSSSEPVPCTGTSPLPAAELPALARAEPSRSAVEAAFAPYVSDMYPQGTLTVYGRVEGGGADGESVVVAACYAAGAANLGNFWAGAVRVRWAAIFPAAAPARGGSRAVRVLGEAQAQSHYFEDGNVQLTAGPRWQHDLELQGDSSAALTALASALVAYARTAEGEWHASLERCFLSLSDTAVKALRRPLPMTKTKFDFDQAIQHKLSEDGATSKQLAARGKGAR